MTIAFLPRPQPKEPPCVPPSPSACSPCSSAPPSAVAACSAALRRPARRAIPAPLTAPAPARPCSRSSVWSTAPRWSNFSTDDVSLRDNRTVSGLAGDERLVGIDYRVQDGKLYGVGDAGGVYTIDETGRGHKVKQLSIELDGQNFGVDFNPAANALRIISDTGQNLRQPFADPAAPTANDKALTNPAAPPATGTVPAVGAASAGYTNNDEDKAPAPRCSCSTPRPTGCPSSPRPTPARSPRWARSASTRGPRPASTSTARPPARRRA